jgi:hypothetical protein
MKGVMSSRRDAVSRKTSRKAGGMEFIDRLYLLAPIINERLPMDAIQIRNFLEVPCTH